MSGGGASTESRVVADFVTVAGGQSHPQAVGRMNQLWCDLASLVEPRDVDPLVWRTG
jgi:hypothetical protein